MYRRSMILLASVLVLTLAVVGAALGREMSVGGEAVQPGLDAQAVADEAPGPAVASQLPFALADAEDAVQAVQVILTFAPGDVMPTHQHGGRVLVSVIAGELTVVRDGGSEEAVYAAGETWIEEPGQQHWAENRGDADVWVAATFLLPAGATPTEFVEMQAAEEEVQLATARANVEIVQAGRAIVSARGNRILADSVPPLGGPNEEINPMDMFLGALGTCGAFIYEATARDMDIPLHSLSIDVEADFAPAGMRDGAVNPRVRAFRAIVTADGPSMEEFEMLADAWRARCPIYTTLELAAPIEITNLPPAHTVELGFVNHIQAGMAEADAYLLDDNGMAFRPMPDQVTDEALDMEVYKVAEVNEHDPFQVGENPIGPYAAGDPLGFTMGEWLAASGGGTYTVQGDRAWVDFAFENLVPNGVYTLWCSFIHVPPNFSIDNYPCGAADGTENTFTADEDGNASIHLVLAEPKPLTTDETLSVFAIAYHSDGNTYGESPGQFGFNSHVQLFVPMPAEEAVME